MKELERHDRAVLQFSGGKDSLACLSLLQPWWEKITVLWANTGDAFPETIEQMRRIRDAVPHFIEVRSDATAHIADYGWPVDVVPTTNTAVGKMLDGHDRPLLQHYTSCCGTNIWRPLCAAAADLGATLVIRGQRLDEHSRSSLLSGEIVEGI